MYKGSILVQFFFLFCNVIFVVLSSMLWLANASTEGDMSDAI